MTAREEFPEWMVTRALAAYVKKEQDGAAWLFGVPAERPEEHTRIQLNA